MANTNKSIGETQDLLENLNIKISKLVREFERSTDLSVEKIHVGKGEFVSCEVHL